MDKEIAALKDQMGDRMNMFDNEKARLEEELKWKDDELNKQLKDAGNNYDKLKELE